MVNRSMTMREFNSDNLSYLVYRYSSANPNLFTRREISFPIPTRSQVKCEFQEVGFDVPIKGLEISQRKSTYTEMRAKVLDQLMSLIAEI